MGNHREPSSEDSIRRYRYSVKEIVTFCCQKDRLESTDAPSPTAKQGQQAHANLQKHRQKTHSSYQAEYSLNYRINRSHSSAPYELSISGRADGIWEDETELTLEEIKTTFYQLAELPDHLHQLHLAQAKLYAFFALQEKHRNQSAPIQVLLTYWHLGTATKYDKKETLSYAELKAFAESTLETFLNWLDYIHEHRVARDQSIQILDFPFNQYREGQKGLAGACYKTVEKRRTTFIHAATGIGKSIGTLFGTLKAIPESSIEHVWYLTAKSSGKAAVNQAATHLMAQGCQLKVLHLYNRGSSCFCDTSTMIDKSQQTLEDTESCEWSTRFYSHWHEAMKALFKHAIIDLALLQTIAKDYQICPYQLAHAMVPWVDIVVADFNFVFSHTNRHNTFIDNRGRSVALLIDEAHNLANRCRELYQVSLRQQDLQLIASLLDTAPSKVKRTISQLKKAIAATKQNQYDSPAKLIDQLEVTKATIDEWQQQQAQLFPAPELLEFKINVNQWLRLSRYLESGMGADHGAHFSLLKHGGSLQLVNNCPAPVIDDLTKSFRSCVYFSGSLLPIAYFCEQLTLQSQEDYTTLVIESPFSPDHLDVYISRLAMNYNQRETAIPAAIEHIECLYQTHDGLYLVCVSSYQFLQQVKNHWVAVCPDIPSLFQPDTREQTNLPEQTDHYEGFLRQLQQFEKGVAFVIMGGRYAEGIEWPAGQLKGVIILGSGMPSPSDTQKRLQTYFENKTYQSDQHHSGFEFAYLFPAINRLIQTAGRIQRREQDTGIVLIMDARYRQPSYQRYFPRLWQPKSIDSPQQLKTCSQAFWQKHQELDDG